jgi:hypothetical protein
MRYSDGHCLRRSIPEKRASENATVRFAGRETRLLILLHVQSLHLQDIR